MREFQEKRKIRKKIYSPYSLGALLLVMAFLGKATWNVYLKYDSSLEKKDRTAAEFQTMEDRHSALEASVARLKTTEGVEEEIREKYRMAKDGEHLLVIVDQEKPMVVPPEKTFFQSMWQKVKGIF